MDYWLPSILFGLFAAVVAWPIAWVLWKKSVRERRSGMAQNSGRSFNRDESPLLFSSLSAVLLLQIAVLVVTPLALAGIMLVFSYGIAD